MDCKLFKKHIHQYFADPDFDWKLREEIDEHFFKCDNCYELYKVAQKMADKAVKDETINKLVYLHVKRAKSFVENNDSVKAIACMQEALNLKPDHIEVIIGLAFLLIENEQYEEGIIIIKKADELYSARTEKISRELIYSIIEEQHFYDSKNILESVNQLYPKSPIILMLLREIYSKNKDYLKAELLLENGRNNNPDNPEILYEAGRFNLEIGRFHEAEKDFENACSIVPDNPRLLTFLAASYLANKKYDDAEKALNKADKINPDHLMTLNFYGLLYLATERIDDAEKALMKSEKLDPENYKTLNNLGLFYLKKKMFDKAISCLKKAEDLALPEKRAITYSNLALIFWEMEDKNNSRHFIDLAFEILSIHRTIKQNRKIIMQELKGRLEPTYDFSAAYANF